MKRLLPVLIVLLSQLCPQEAFALFGKRDRFYPGSVVLHSGDSIICKMRFTRKVAEGLLQIRNGDKVCILTVKDVRSFSFEDPEKKRRRSFVNVNLLPDLSTRRHEVFVEIIHGSGQISIVCHRTLGYAKGSLQINPFRKKQVVNRYYLYRQNSEETLPLTPENILQMLHDKRDKIAPYVQGGGIRLKTVCDYIDLLDYHLSL